MSIDVAKLHASALEVAREANAHQDALNEERSAEADVLDATIEAVRPALPAISSRLIRVSRPGHDDIEREYFDERGVPLSQSGPNSLFLLDDGDLAFATDQTFHDDVLLTLGPLRRISTREAMDHHELDACLAAIEKAVEGQKGKRKGAIEKAKKRAKVLRVDAEHARSALGEGAPDDDIPF